MFYPDNKNPNHNIKTNEIPMIFAHVHTAEMYLIKNGSRKPPTLKCHFKIDFCDKSQSLPVNR
jgi:hypothetical protein